MLPGGYHYSPIRRDHKREPGGGGRGNKAAGGRLDSKRKHEGDQWVGEGRRGVSVVKFSGCDDHEAKGGTGDKRPTGHQTIDSPNWEVKVTEADLICGLLREKQAASSKEKTKGGGRESRAGSCTLSRGEETDGATDDRVSPIGGNGEGSRSEQNFAALQEADHQQGEDERGGGEKMGGE